MSQSVQEISELQEYLRGVLDRADHHAGSVNDVSIMLVGLVLWKKDPEPIRVMTREGHTTNVLWVHIGGVKYVFAYSHEEGVIEMREGLRGPVKRTFSNRDTLADLKKFFEKL